MRAFVTGASGFVGQAVCAQLLTRGHEVTALVRRPGSEPPGTTAAQGDLTHADPVSRALEAAAPDCVIHLAAEIATQRDLAKIEEVNVHATSRLIGACESGTEARFIFMSTVVTGDAGGAMLNESSALPVQTAYGRSKQRGEELVRESGLASVILRPSHIYGPGGWYASELVKRLRAPGRLVVIGSGKNWWDVVRVEDVAAACVDAAERAPDGSVYHVVDDEPITQYDFVALTAQALGVGTPRRVPLWLASLVSGADPARAVIRSARSSNARIKQELGWAPRFPSARQGVPDAVAHLPA
ncbi:MAG TPA: NAD(P)-dependent oxidoreductase [Solirubrobacteraceae bacterium]|nr:NAD(P)-dependent oxidoreductase [Solirubrobacteraceae bacterium]